MATINVIYHHYPHYRAPVMRAMATRGKHTYRFWGGLADFQGIKAFRGDEVVKIHPLTFRGDEKTGRMSISGYWPAVYDRSADGLIIIGNANITATWLMAAAGRLAGKKVLFWAHGWRRPEPVVKAALRRFYYNLADRVLLYGHRAVSLAIAAGFPPRKLTVIYNSLDWEKSRSIDDRLQLIPKDALRGEFNLPPDRPILICTARLVTSCRFDLLLESAALLKQHGLPVVIVLVGDGPQRTALEQQARRLSVDARFLGAIYDEEVLARLFRAADVTVSPGKVGLTAMHSMTYGVPVITHGNLNDQMPEVEAIEPGKTGEFFRQDDAADLARVLLEWLRSDRDHGEIAAACRGVVSQRYNPLRQTELIDQAVSEALHDPS